MHEAAASRRNTWLSATDPMSHDNFLRLFSQDPEVSSDREVFFEKLRTDEAFPMVLHAYLDKLLPGTFEGAAKET